MIYYNHRKRYNYYMKERLRGKTMKELKASTKRGQDILDRVLNHEGYGLLDVYNTVSMAKYRAWDWCFQEFMNTDDHYNFGICSHNTFGFTCGWLGKKDGERIARYETKDNSYLVWLDR